ncbi:hypothetical protein ASD11_16420 [Aeromicrobium sp. Root495]|uniref:hypothetical protein n=1 Tax=Aeromicrobium sp. Root495 TaxID=1736550 RepID=UPI0006FF0302|nr:hypothetical protein [Aeromicrobium sp. Root495]KQY56054.1 hypothetical protein ASD11_16420 [Aeromicrobium sp. Root495]
MTADRVSLTEGYEGAIAGHRSVAGSGEGVQGLAKKQHGQTSELQGQNKGAFATQAANGSTATANNLGAAALLHTANAEGGARYVKQTAAHEDEASSGQAAESNALDQAASDLHSKINRA